MFNPKRDWANGFFNNNGVVIGKAKWLQVAAKRLLESGEFNEATISELAVLCQQEANNEFSDIDYSIPTSAFDTHDLEEIRLDKNGVTH